MPGLRKLEDYLKSIAENHRRGTDNIHGNHRPEKSKELKMMIYERRNARSHHYRAELSKRIMK